MKITYQTQQEPAHHSWVRSRRLTLRPLVKSNRSRCPQSVAVVELSNDIVGHHAFARKALYSCTAKPGAQSKVELGLR
jgi:hypothetical protein